MVTFNRFFVFFLELFTSNHKYGDSDEGARDSFDNEDVSGFNIMQTADIKELMLGSHLDKDEGEVQLLTSDLIRKGLKFATSMEQDFLTHDPDIEDA